MEKYDSFKENLKKGAEKFLNIPKKETIRIIGHLDADGICASSIIINALTKLNRKYTLTILPTITDESLEQLKSENEKYFVFVDLGSGSLDSIGRILSEKNIFILDHHHPQSTTIYNNITQINPHLFNIDGSDEISGAGVVFLFTQELVDNSEMSRIAIVGAIGDIQENNGFKKLNSEILNIAINKRLIEVKKGLKFFGVQTKPIHKLLQYSSEIIIPDVTGSESGAIKFLQQIGINPQTKKGWKKISELTDDEKKRLIAAIVMKSNNSKPEDIFTNNYLLIGEKEDSPFRDAKEFATLLNSCGRLNKASIGIGACLNDPKMKKMAIENLTQYRREIVNALNWYKDNEHSDKIFRKKNILIINAEEEVLPTMIGTLGSILSKSQDIEKNTFILSLARNYDNTTKVSLRISGKPENINLKDVIQKIIEESGNGSSGGHAFASGAVISTDYEERFIESALKVLSEFNFELINDSIKEDMNNKTVINEQL
ncbi:MAG: single-stranded DNA endonuclease [Candidatus Woesearchaeota archaeon]|nr:MAG: single-stranded DNA endonuclease [Candidatus Woesearchaeota archaeon]